MHPFFDDPWLLYYFITNYPNPKMLKSFMIVSRKLNKYIKDQNLQDKLYNCVLKKRSETYCYREIFQVAEYIFEEYSILPNKEYHGTYRRFRDKNLIECTEYYRGKKHGLSQTLVTKITGTFLKETHFINGVIKWPIRIFYTNANVNAFPTKTSLFCEQIIVNDVLDDQADGYYKTPCFYHLTRYWYENGQLMIESSEPTGIKAWHHNGTLAATVRYVAEKGLVGQAFGSNAEPLASIEELPGLLLYWIYDIA